MENSQAVHAFWQRVRGQHPDLPESAPEAWAFGVIESHANELLALVLDGSKTATASSLWDYETSGEAVPEAGDLSIILDGSGEPRAVIETMRVQIVPFDEVGDDHAYAEGEDDRTLETWRSEHERYWRNYAESPRPFAADMPIICERFRRIYPVSES